MKVLCVCQGGNVRSVAMATELKQRYRLDALAVGFEKNSASTVQMLMDWADVVIVMKVEYVSVVPEKHASKIFIADVGDDTYGTPSNKDLRKMVQDKARSLIGVTV